MVELSQPPSQLHSQNRSQLSTLEPASIEESPACSLFEIGEGFCGARSAVTTLGCVTLTWLQGLANELIAA